MEPKKEGISLYKLMYSPSPKRKQQSDLPGPLFDLTVIALGIISAIGYLVTNHTG